MSGIFQWRSTFFESVQRALGEERQDIKMRDKALVLEADAMFETNTADLHREGRSIVNVVSNAATRVGNDIGGAAEWVLQIDLHACGSPGGPFASKQALTEAQGAAIQGVLGESAFPSAHLVINAYGEDAPVDRRGPDAAHRRNRRVEIRFTDPNTPPTEPEIQNLVRQAIGL